MRKAQYKCYIRPGEFDAEEGGGEKRMKEGSSSLTMIGGNRIKMQFSLVYFAQLFSRAGGHSQEQENRQFSFHIFILKSNPVKKILPGGVILLYFRPIESLHVGTIFENCWAGLDSSPHISCH